MRDRQFQLGSLFSSLPSASTEDVEIEQVVDGSANSKEPMPECMVDDMANLKPSYRRALIAGENGASPALVTERIRRRS